MPVDGSQPEEIGRSGDSKEAAVPPWSQVILGRPESWVEEETYDRQVRPKEGAHTTYLLWARQVDAGSGKSFHATAARLETSLAVQNESQWRLNFDARFQEVTLHWLRVVRNGESIDHLRRDRMRLMQRETQLERYIINGNWTLLIVLEDIRPGDIIEAAYSFKSWHPISRGCCEMFFAVPPYAVVGRYHASVIFEASRPGMAWKASFDAPGREEKVGPDGRIAWHWVGSQVAPREPEVNSPTTHLDYVWIQVSDVAGWGQLARKAADGWSSAECAEGDLEQGINLARPQGSDASVVAWLVRRIQDDFRYFSIDLATGGWIPAAPGAVVRRRYGDCKDLVWLAVAVLRRWGLKARPILVGSGFRGRIASLLPMTALFNHAVMEVDVGGSRRWFDLTLRSQGGNFETQPVNLYGCGLPVDAKADSLQDQPGRVAPNLYALRETIALNTRREEASVVELRLWTEGFQAENLRRARLAQGTDGFADERLKLAERRYGKARRLGTLQWRDDREGNICELVEAFEIRDIINAGESGKRASYDVPVNTLIQSFAVPPEKPRRTPWSLPFPLEIRHMIVAKSRSMGARGQLRRKWADTGFIATLEESQLRGEWTKSARLLTNAPEIAPEKAGACRAQLLDFFRATSWRLYLPWKSGRPEMGSDFGRLPDAGVGANAYVPAEDLSLFSSAIIGQNPKKHWRDRFFSSWNLRLILLALWILIGISTALVRGCATG